MTFKEWVNQYGMPKLADRLGLTRQCIQKWMVGLTYPSVKTAKRIVRLSKGEIDYNSIYGA